MIVAADAKAKERESAWITQMEQNINTDENELCELLDAKERELYAACPPPANYIRANFLRADQDRKFKSDIRALVSSVLFTPGSKPKVRVEAKTRRITTEDSGTETDPRPGYAHVALLVAKSERLLELYKQANTAISKAPSANYQMQKYAKDKEEMEHMLGVGKQVAQRRIDEVLQNDQPETLMKARKVDTSKSYSEEDLKLAEVVFGRKDNRGLGIPDGAGGAVQEMTRPTFDGPGVYRLLHDAERGVKRFVINLPFLETDPADSEG